MHFGGHALFYPNVEENTLCCKNAKRGWSNDSSQEQLLMITEVLKISDSARSVKYGNELQLFAFVSIKHLLSFCILAMSLTLCGHYRPQRSCEGYVLQVSVCPQRGSGPGGIWSQGGRVPGPGGGGSVPGGGGVVSQLALRQTSWERRLLLRTVHILLQCILVICRINFLKITYQLGLRESPCWKPRIRCIPKMRVHYSDPKK